jgi:AbrB family looped-hinge helix DNA binding protein
MKVGVIKEIDKLGRIVIPKEFRERLGIGKEVEIVLTNEGLLIRNPEFVLIKRDNVKND